MQSTYSAINTIKASKGISSVRYCLSDAAFCINLQNSIYIVVYGMLESLQFMQKITSDNNLSREEESLIFIFHINILKRFLANAVVSKTNQCTTIFGTKSTTTDKYWSMYQKYLYTINWISRCQWLINCLHDLHCTSNLAGSCFTFLRGVVRFVL